MRAQIRPLERAQSSFDIPPRRGAESYEETVRSRSANVAASEPAQTLFPNNKTELVEDVPALFFF